MNNNNTVGAYHKSKMFITYYNAYVLGRRIILAMLSILIIVMLNWQLFNSYGIIYVRDEIIL